MLFWSHVKIVAAAITASVLVAGVAGLSISLAQSAPAPAAATAPATRAALESEPVVKDGISLVLVASKGTFGANDPAKFTVKITNVSKTDITLPTSSTYGFFRLEDVKTGQAYTGASTFPTGTLVGGEQHPKPRVIKAGETITEDHSFEHYGFAPGAIVTIPRTIADTVVTEYGVAYLKGRTVREREISGLDHLTAPQIALLDNLVKLRISGESPIAAALAPKRRVLFGKK